MRPNSIQDMIQNRDYFPLAHLDQARVLGPLLLLLHLSEPYQQEQEQLLKALKPRSNCPCRHLQHPSTLCSGPTASTTTTKTTRTQADHPSTQRLMPPKPIDCCLLLHINNNNNLTITNQHTARLHHGQTRNHSTMTMDWHRYGTSSGIPSGHGRWLCKSASLNLLGSFLPSSLVFFSTSSMLSPMVKYFFFSFFRHLDC